MNRFRHNLPWLLGLCLGWMIVCPKAVGQTDQDPFMHEMEILEIENRMLDFYNQLNDLSTQIPQYSPDQLAKADQQVTAIDTKWNIYFQSKQATIAEDDSLLQIVANYQLVKQSLMDSISSKQHFYEALQDFSDAEIFFAGQDSIYTQLYQTALEYSLVKSLDAELEKIKEKEKSQYTEIQSYYETTQNLAEEFGIFQPRFQKIKKKYIELTHTSEKIQDLKFEPWLQRIKDYLYSFAAVAMILMFINMVQAKLKSFKQARENIKKLREMTQQDADEYPTI